jgi:hypothetical protein
VTLELLSVLHLEFLDLLVELADPVIVFSTRVSNDLGEALIFEVKHERGTIELAFVEDFKLDHKLVKLVFEWGHKVFKGNTKILVPSWHFTLTKLSLISKDEVIDVVLKQD